MNFCDAGATYSISRQTKKRISKASRGQLAMNLRTAVLRQSIAKLGELARNLTWWMQFKAGKIREPPGYKAARWHSYEPIS